MLPSALPSVDALSAASPWVVRWAYLIKSAGRVLDVACGAGRHSLLLTQMGYYVTAVDRDAAALSALSSHNASTDVPPIQTCCADIENGVWPFTGEQFDGVVVTNYLHRPLFPALIANLAEGGVLIYETFTTGHETLGRPSRPEFLLRTGELLVQTEGLRVVAFEEGYLSEPKPALVQRLCAVKMNASNAVVSGEKPLYFPL